MSSPPVPHGAPAPDVARLAGQGLGVRVGARWIVRNVDVAVARGEVLVVLGPNGAGKTTLLEGLSCVRLPDEGTVRVDGAVVRSFRDAARAFAFLPDAARLPAEAKVGTLLAHAARLAAPASAVDLAPLGATALAAQPAGVLSRGEAQRVLLHTTLVLGRPVVVLDEPLAPFDPVQVREVVRLVRRVAEAGAAVVASVHQLGDAAKLGDRFLLLAEGRALACGDLASLRREAGLASTATLEDVFLALVTRRGDAA